MDVGGILMTHAIARKEGKLPFFFSRFKFEAMRKRGNTHFCFACLSGVGYTPDENGNPTNHLEDGWDGQPYSGMDHHNETHKDFIIGNADKYDGPREWLEHEIPKDFPCVVALT